jgi:hypothetical protein
MDHAQQTDHAEHRAVSADLAREQEAEWAAEQSKCDELYGPCSDEYGPCEAHGWVLVQREGASTRTADELVWQYAQDTADLLEDLGGIVLQTDRDILFDAWELLERNRRHGVAWLPEDDCETLDELVRLGDALSVGLAEHNVYAFHDDGYRIVLLTGGPLLAE